MEEESIMSLPMHGEIDAPPYRPVINAESKYRTGSPGEIVIDLESAIRDGEQRAREAINDGLLALEWQSHCGFLLCACRDSGFKLSIGLRTIGTESLRYAGRCQERLDRRR
ncbi:hypothetical protein BZM27_38920 [Paraburkholderia steynii]|uniref:Uncharacterized protein n=1 Tax=Paraburkholderia steynii TaxID=1245441 RepID=A0A4R0X3L9_9BURK|nr:hypothetical protein BZM27_38920 [Paraburkholderia steynii]